MALTYAFSAVEALSAGLTPTETALRYYDSVADEADGVYRESAAQDRLRIYQARELEIPEWDRDEMDRQELIVNVGRGALRNPVLGRALLKRMNLLGRPDEILDDAEVVKAATETRDYFANREPRKVGPDREEMLELLAAHGPA